MEYFEFVEKMKEKVFGQDEYIRTLAAMMVLSEKKKELLEEGNEGPYPLSTLLVAGATGSGKTYAVEKMGELLDREVFVIDMTGITGEGYKGKDLMEEIGRAVGGKEEAKVKNGIFFFDEFDKCIISHSEEERARTSNPIPQFLKFLEGSPMVPKGLVRDGAPIQIPTANMTFIFAGAFDGIEEIVKDRLKSKETRKQIGFLSSNDSGSDGDAGDDGTSNVENEDEMLLSMVQHDDFKKYNLDQQFLGRMENIIILNKLKEKDYERIISESSESGFQKFKHIVADGFGADIEITSEACGVIGRECIGFGTGARGISTAISKIEKQALEALLKDEGVGKIVVDGRDDALVIDEVRCDRRERKRPAANEKVMPAAKRAANPAAKKAANPVAKETEMQTAKEVVIEAAKEAAKKAARRREAQRSENLTLSNKSNPNGAEGRINSYAAAMAEIRRLTDSVKADEADLMEDTKNPDSFVNFRKRIEGEGALKQPIQILKGLKPGPRIWIHPVEIKGDDTYEESQYQCDENSISMAEAPFRGMLEMFFMKYFDKDHFYNTLRLDEEREAERRTGFFDGDYVNTEAKFDKQEYNYYSYRTIKKMLFEIDAVRRMIELDYNNPKLDEIKRCWCSTLILSEEELMEELGLTNDECLEKYRQRLANFYREFVRAMREMMRTNADKSDIGLIYDM